MKDSVLNAIPVGWFSFVGLLLTEAHPLQAISPLPLPSVLSQGRGGARGGRWPQAAGTKPIPGAESTALILRRDLIY